MPQQVIAGNWKMYKNRIEARTYLEAFLPLIDQTPAERRIILCVPFTCLDTFTNTSTRIQVGAQNIHWQPEGAYTGEISAPMLVELKVRYVTVGHSERRQYFNETDETVNLRLKAAQLHEITPILCVGESKQHRIRGETESWIRNQLDVGLQGVNLERLIIAYEPIWAIGTGDTCAAQEADRVIGEIRSHLGNYPVPILYGGSVKPSNIDEIMAEAQIDGVLVGGASLDPLDFGRIANFQPLGAALKN